MHQAPNRGYVMCKKILSIAIIFCGSLFFCRNDLMAFAIQDSNLAYAQIVSLNQIRAVGLQTVGTVVVWNQAGDPADIHNDDGWPVWLECDGSSFDTGYYTTLASIIPGGVLPNLKDQFLRGGTSGQVGQMAHDSTREHYHGQPPHTHSFNGYLVSGAISGSASSQAYADMWTDIGHGGYSLKEGDLSELGHQVRDSSSRYTSGGTISGSVVNTAVAGTISASGGDNTSRNSNSDGTSGGSETAPQHIRVRYLIRALP